MLVVGLLAACGACGKRPVDDGRPAAASVASIVVVPPPVTVPPVMVNPPAVAAADKPAPKKQESDELPGAPAATTLPAGFADLTKTVRLEIKDAWDGMGSTHELVAMLERAPGARSFTVNAKVAAHPYPPLKETVPDPTAPRHRWEVETGDQCTIRNMDTGKCEDPPEMHKATYKTKKGTVDAATVESFLAEIASRSIDPKQEEIAGMWTDDYPSGHVTVWVPGVKEPIHLAFRDQRRHWRVNGAFLTLDPGAAAPSLQNRGPGMGIHKQINERYQRMLKNMGLEGWIKDVNASRTTR